MSAQRITSISRARFQELRQQWLDGVLSEKWKDKTPTTKADKVEDKQIRAMAKSFAADLVTFCPPSRELSLALTELENAVMWANAAIARNE